MAQPILLHVVYEMKYICPQCKTCLSFLKIFLVGKMECKECHAICQKKMTILSYFLSLPIWLFSLWLIMFHKSFISIPMLLLSWLVADIFALIIIKEDDVS